MQGRSLLQRLWLSLASLASLSLTGLEDPPRVKVTGSSATRLALGMPHSPVDQCPGVKRRSVLLGWGAGLETGLGNTYSPLSEVSKTKQNSPWGTVSLLGLLVEHG